MKTFWAVLAAILVAALVIGVVSNAGEIKAGLDLGRCHALGITSGETSNAALVHCREELAYRAATAEIELVAAREHAHNPAGALREKNVLRWAHQREQAEAQRQAERQRLAAEDAEAESYRRLVLANSTDSFVKSIMALRASFVPFFDVLGLNSKERTAVLAALGRLERSAWVYSSGDQAGARREYLEARLDWNRAWSQVQMRIPVSALTGVQLPELTP